MTEEEIKVPKVEEETEKHKKKSKSSRKKPATLTPEGKNTFKKNHFYNFYYFFINIFILYYFFIFIFILFLL